MTSDCNPSEGYEKCLGVQSNAPTDMQENLQPEVAKLSAKCLGIVTFCFIASVFLPR